MFRCQVTGKCSKPGEKQFRIVVATRPKEYECFNAEGALLKITRGYEIAREITCSLEGLEVWDGMSLGAKAKLLGKDYGPIHVSVRSAA